MSVNDVILTFFEFFDSVPRTENSSIPDTFPSYL